MTRRTGVGWYVIKRVLLLVPLLIGVSFITFMLIRLGDSNPAVLIAGPTATPAEIAQVEEELGLDDPLLVQYASYVAGVVRGDFGESWLTRRTVVEELRERVPITLELITVGMFAAVIAGVGVGFASAMLKDRLPDQVARFGTLLGISMPIFWLGLLLIYLFFVTWKLAPGPVGRLDIFVVPPQRVTGFLIIDSVLEGNWEALRSYLAHLVLPTITIMLVTGATIAKQTRSGVVDVRNSAAARYAVAAGLPRWRIWRMILHNALPTIITFSAIAYSLGLGGSALVELIFSWGGMGQLGIEAITKVDYAIVQGYVLVMGVIVAVVYLLADLAVAIIDPRVSNR